MPWLYNRCRRRQDIFLGGEEGEEVEIEVPPPPMPSQGLWSDFRAHVRSLMTEGAFIVFLDLVRTICLCALVGLSFLAAVQAEPPQKGQNESYAEIMKKKKKKGKKKKKKPILDEFSALEWAEFGVSLFYVRSSPVTAHSSSTTSSSASSSSRCAAPSSAGSSLTMSTCSSSSRSPCTRTATSGRRSPTTSRPRT